MTMSDHFPHRYAQIQERLGEIGEAIFNGDLEPEALMVLKQERDRLVEELATLAARGQILPPPSLTT